MARPAANSSYDLGMQTFTVEHRRYDATDPRLGRHVRHDSRNRQYAYVGSRTAPLVSVTHQRYVPVFDQGNVGSCTGNAGLGCLGTGRFYATVVNRVPFTEAEALAVYSAATKVDGVDGTYLPDDTGSDGPAVGKVLTTAGDISGYKHAFTLKDALAALMDRPIIVGTNWYDAMFEPSADGLVAIGGKVAGGHEYVADSYDVETDLVGFHNSWGEGWGVGGRFFMTSDTLGRLLSEQGDATIFVPNTDTPPESKPPVPPSPDSDVHALAKSVRGWRHSTIPEIGARSARNAVNRFLVGRGY